MPRALALVVLAACESGVPGRGYDEAFSIATVFLTCGARSVVSSMWSVPDSATSVLMFMFHHYLRTDAPAPWEALHRALARCAADTAGAGWTADTTVGTAGAGSAGAAWTADQDQPYGLSPQHRSARSPVS